MNEIKKPDTKLAKTEGERNLKLQTVLLNQLEEGATEMGQSFSAYGKQCVINAIAALFMLCKNQDIKMEQIDGTMIRLALQNIGYTELNVAAIPSECYFDLRKTYVDGKETYSISIKPQGAGNEKLTRKYGVGIAPGGLRPAWLVREGDDFEFPSFNGLEMTPPKWTPKSYDAKVIMVVYPVVKTDGSHEFLIATREGIKPNIIAQIRQNALYADDFKNPTTHKLDKAKRDAFYERVNNELDKLTVDQIFSDPEWMKWINPTYTSGGSKEAMIIRKIKNNALKNYPKEYDNAYISNAVQNMFEDKDDSLNEPAIKARKKTVDEVIDQTEKDINETTDEEPVLDFNVDDLENEANDSTDDSSDDYEDLI